MEAQLPVALILMHVELPEDLGCVQEVGVVDDSRDVLVATLWIGEGEGEDVLVDVPCQQWQVQDERDPVAVD
jgi:hypothetical protein